MSALTFEFKSAATGAEARTEAADGARSSNFQRFEKMFAGRFGVSLNDAQCLIIERVYVRIINGRWLNNVKATG